MKANIFKELLKYASFKEKKPRENIFTGSLSFLLKENEYLKISFVKYLIKLYRDKNKRFRMPQISLGSLVVSTQSSHQRADSEVLHGRNQIDIEIGDPGRQFGIFIENKIDASISPSQAERYGNQLTDNYEKGMLIFISRSGFLDIDKNIKYIQLRWTDVYSVFRKHLRTERNKINQYLLREFLDYMKEEDMKPNEGLDKKEFKGVQWGAFITLLKNLKGFLNSIKGLLEEREKCKVLPVTVSRERDVYISVTKLRKVEFWRRNKTKIYFGININNKDIQGKAYVEKAPEGLLLYFGFWTHSSKSKAIKFYKKIDVKIRRLFGKDYIIKGNREIWIYTPLEKVIGNNKHKQNDRLINYCQKALNKLEKSGIIKMLSK